MEEDSGYCSTRSGQFKFNSQGKRQGFILDDIFDLKFSDIGKSKAYRYFRHGFKDEEDFEEFKQDLKDFRKLKEEFKEEYEYSDPRRGIRTKTTHRRSRCVSGSRDKLNDTLMDFFKGDEHFQEFERVFDTISSRKRFSTDSDPFRWRGSGTSNGEGAKGSDRSDLGDDGRKGDRNSMSDRRGDRNSMGDMYGDVFPDLSIDDSFMDFFNNDEDFMEFELELEKFKSNRRSRLFDDLHRRSSCDIFGDVKAFCDRSLNNNTKNGSRSDLRGSRGDLRGSRGDLCGSRGDLRGSRGDLRGSRGDLRGSRGDLRGSSNDHGGSRSDLRGSRGDLRKSRSDLRASKSDLRVSRSDLRGSRSDLGGSQNDLSGSLCDLRDSDSSMWKSAEEWDFVLNKLKRNSRLFSDNGPPPDSEILSDKPVYVHRIRVEGQPSREKDCQYTCHHSCVKTVSLDCTSVQQGVNGDDAKETSLSEHQLRNSPKTSISKKSVVQNSQNDDIAQRLAQLPPISGPGIAQRVENSVDNSGDAPADNTNEKDETDSGYRSGTIPDDKLPKQPSQATLNRDELRKKIAEFNHCVPGSEFEMMEDRGEAFQGFIKVTLNFVRPITMSLSLRPPSIYDLLTKEHIVEQNTQSIAFYMPRDTIKSIHVESITTTKEVVAALLKKFHILDHPRKFAMYEQEFSKNRLLKVKRVGDKDFPLQTVLNWDIHSASTFRLVLQENETGEIVWEGFSKPELQNFLKVLDREEDECISQLNYKYKVMKRIINQRLKELRRERKAAASAENSPS